MQKEAFEPTGLIPRSIIRTVDRFLQQLFPGREKIAVQEYRVSRYQILVSIKTLLTLICVPLLVKYTLKYVLLTPLIEHFWNSYQSEVFLNQYQEKRAFAEMEEFSEKMFFEFLSEPNEVPRATINPQHITVAVKQGDECDVWSYKPEVCTSEAIYISDVYKSLICTNPAMYVSNVGYKRPELLRVVPSESRHQAVLGLVPGLVPTQNAAGRRFDETPSLPMLTPALGRCPTSTTDVLFASTTSVSTQVQLTSCLPTAYIAKRSYISNVSMPAIPPKVQLLVSAQPELFFIKSSTGDQNFAQPLSCVASTALTGALNSWGFDTVLPETDHGLILQDYLHLKDRSGCTNRRFVHTSGGICGLSDVCFVHTSGGICGLSDVCVVNDARTLGEGNSCLHGWCNVSLSKHNLLLDEETKSLDDVYQNDGDANLLQTYKGLFQLKSLELARAYNEQSISSIANLLGDFATFFTLYLLVRVMRPEIIILKSFLTESVYSLSDTTKSFLLILGMDLLVGFHSPRAWEIALETFLRHIGLPENENFILLFVALFPVFLDTVFKYWIFRYLNKISPSTVVTYHSMIE